MTSSKVEEVCDDCDDFVQDVVCLTTDLEENQLRVFKLKLWEVLLIKQNSQIKALGINCTHCGAPLVSGALGCNRIRCQWHGTVFNITTGDIEEYPGIDALPVYEVKIDGNKVIVKGVKRHLMENRRIKPMVENFSCDADKVVVIGGGAAASTCVETLRQEGFSGAITMICKEDVLPYERTKFRKQLDCDITEAQLRDREFYKKYGITVMLGIHARAIDTKEKTVTLSDKTNIAYTKLLIATGNSPKRPQYQGAHLENVFVLRNYYQANGINCRLNKDTNVVIIGDNFTTMECANFIVERVKKLTILKCTILPLADKLGERIAENIIDLYKKKGVEFIQTCSIKKIVGGCIVEGVELGNGTIIPADIVICDTPDEPNTSFLERSAIKTDPNGTISTNKYLECNVPNIYIGGDIANAPVFMIDNNKAAIDYFGVAQYHGKIAALNMVGNITELKTIPYFTCYLAGHCLRYCGYSDFEDILYAGNVEGMEFVAFYIKENHVVNICSCNMDPFVSKFAELAEEERKLTRDDITCNPLSWVK